MYGSFIVKILTCRCFVVWLIFLFRETGIGSIVSWLEIKGAISVKRKSCEFIKSFLNSFLEEIKLLQNAEGLTEAQERNRDIFVFACYTGLAYADIKGLRKSNISTDQMVVEIF